MLGACLATSMSGRSWCALRYRASAWALCLLPLLPGPRAASPEAAPATDDQEIQGQLNEVTNRLNSLDAWLSEADRQRTELLADLREKDNAVAVAANAVAESDGHLAEIGTQVEELRARRHQYRIRQSLEAARIGQVLAAAYRLRGQGFLKLLLNQQDPAQAGRLLVYHRHLIDIRMEAYESFRRASEQLGQNATALAARRADQRIERQRLLRRHDELKRNRTERQVLIATLEMDVADKTGQRKALLLDQQRLQALLAALQRQSTDLDDTGFADRQGALPWPLRGALLNRFGDARADGRLRWQGLLIKAEPGSPVKAIFRGRVAFAEWMRGFGLLTILDHGDGYMTLYAHADRLAKRRGDLVESGEIIAHAGQSGGLETSGLYFEMRQDGIASDPLPWLDEPRR